MKKRSCAYLFLAALMGVFFGIEIFIANKFYFVLLAIPVIALLVCSKNIARALCLLFFTFFVCAFSASLLKQNHNNIVATIKKESASYQGVIKNVWPKIDGSIKALIKIHLVNQKPAASINMLVNFYDSAAMLDISPGAQVLFSAKAKLLPPALSHAHFDGQRYGLAKNIHAKAHVKNSKLVFIQPRSDGNFFAKLRHFIRLQLTTHLSPRESSLLLALMIGETSLFEDEQREIYSQLGAQHLLAVSGLQVTLIAIICFFVLLPIFSLLLPLSIHHYSRGLASLITLIIIWWFVLLCGCPKSAIRAALMTSIMLSSNIFVRRIDLYDAFFLSGFVIILADPLSAIDLGFLLSYSALFGILTAAQHGEWLIKKIAEKTLVGAWASALLLTSTAAFLGTLPIIATTFFSVTPLSIMANVVLVPVASALQAPAIIFGMAGALMSLPKLIFLGAKCAAAIEVLATVLQNFFGATIIYLPPMKATIFFCALMLGVIFLASLSRKYFIVGAALSAAAIPLLMMMNTAPKNLQVTLVPVGQGDATIFSMPSGHAMLVDAGGNMYGDFDPAKRYVIPSLLRRGIDFIDVLAITHPDHDHIMGAFTILEQMPVGEIWAGGFSENHPLAQKLVSLAAQKNIPIKYPHEILGSHYFGDTEIEVLSPKVYNPSLSTNNNSLVIKVVFHDTALLWPGDIEDTGEKLLLKNNTQVFANILKAPHHGSKTSSSTEFIDKVSPHYVLYSTGRNNRFNFPHPQVAARYQARNITAFNTATHGEINIEVTRHHFSFTTFHTAL